MRYKVFGGYIQATVLQTGIIRTAPVAAIEYERSIALGRLLDKCRKMFPTTEGYGNHTVDVTELGDNNILRLLASLGVIIQSTTAP